MNIKKSLASLLVAATLAGTFSAPVNAASISAVETGAGITAVQANLNGEPISYGKPILESTYTDKEGTEVTEKIYFVPAKPSNNIQNYTTKFNDMPVMSGEGWYKKERVHKWKGGAGETKYWVRGYFVTVSQCFLLNYANTFPSRKQFKQADLSQRPLHLPKREAVPSG